MACDVRDCSVLEGEKGFAKVYSKAHRAPVTNGQHHHHPVAKALGDASKSVFTGQLALIVTCSLVFLCIQLLIFKGYHDHLSRQADKEYSESRTEYHAEAALREQARMWGLLHRLDARLDDIYSAVSSSARRDRERRKAEAEATDAQPGARLAAMQKQARSGAVPGADNIRSGNEDTECVFTPDEAVPGAVAAVVTVSFNRPDYLQRHLDSLLAVHGQDADNRQRFPLYVSQDGTPPHSPTQAMARSHAPAVTYLHHHELRAPVPERHKEKLAYYRIAAHYKFILRTFFDCLQYDKLIILEDDMELAADFFSYFSATAPLLDRDDTLMCVSSWNDHGQDQFVRDAHALYRSDFFPGLGWMLRRQLWDELKSSWPRGYWDDWMREANTRRGRQCIRPEVCRTFNFGEKGTSGGFYFRRFLAPIRLNGDPIRWEDINLSYLEPQRYAADFNATLAAAPVIETLDELRAAVGDVRLLYASQEDYEAITARLRMLREWKAGVPRAGYQGVVVVHVGAARVFITPAPNFRPPVRLPDEKLMIDATGAIVHKGRPRTTPALRYYTPNPRADGTDLRSPAQDAAVALHAAEAQRSPRPDAQWPAAHVFARRSAKWDGAGGGAEEALMEILKRKGVWRPAEPVRISPAFRHAAGAEAAPVKTALQRWRAASADGVGAS